MKLISMFCMFCFVVILNITAVVAQTGQETHVVYRDKGNNLFSVLTTGGEPLRLTPEDARVDRYDITSAGNVVYRDSKSGLFVVPVSGGKPRQLNEGASVLQSYVISSDGNYVVYTDGAQLYSVSIEGDEPIQLNAAEQKLGIEPYYEYPRTLYDISPDSSHVIFTAANARDVYQLYAVPITGGETVQLNPRLVSGGNVTSFGISSDSKHVVYAADQKVDEKFDLFSIGVDGGESLQLTSGDTVAGEWAGLLLNFSPDGQWVIYQGYSSRVETNFMARVDGGSVDTLKLGVSPYDWGIASSVHLSKDSTQLFINNPGSGRILEVPIGGKNPDGAETLDKPQQVVKDCQCSFIVSPDETYLIFIDQITYQIGGVSLPKGSKFNTNSLGYTHYYPRNFEDYTTSWVVATEISPDSQYVVTFQYNENTITNLYSIKIVDGATNQDSIKQLNAYPSSASFRDQMFRITEDSSTVIYTNDEEAEGYVDLYSVPIDGGEVVRLTSDDSKGVTDFKLYPKGTDWFWDFPNKLR